MGVITIKGLRIQARHGVMEQERKVGNTFEVDILLDVPKSDEAMRSDNIDDTVNYAEVVEIVKKEMAKPSKLIENVAGRIAQAIKERYQTLVVGGEVTVSKLAPPIPAELDYVSFTAEI